MATIFTLPQGFGRWDARISGRIDSVRRTNIELYEAKKAQRRRAEKNKARAEHNAKALRNFRRGE